MTALARVVPVLAAPLVLALAAPATAQVPCLRHETSFSCADGTSLPIYDDPWQGWRGRARAGLAADEGAARGDGWWKDDRYVHGPRGEACLVHGNHVHCGGVLGDVP